MADALSASIGKGRLPSAISLPGPNSKCFDPISLEPLESLTSLHPTVYLTTNQPTYKMASVTNSVVTLFTQQLLFYSCARSVGVLTQGPCWSNSHTACCTHGGGVYVEFSHPLLS